MEFLKKVGAWFTSQSQPTQNASAAQELLKMRDDAQARVVYLQAEQERLIQEHRQIEQVSQILPGILQKQAQLEQEVLTMSKFVDLQAEGTLKSMQYLKSQFPPPDPYQAEQAARAAYADYKAQQNGGNP